ncbi:MAG: hypothetical protein ABR497_10545 [Kiritimatiellia bacterium]
MQIEYPPAFARKVIRNEASGGAFHHLSMVAPTIVQPGRPFSLKLALTDEKGLAVVSDAPRLGIMLEGVDWRAAVDFPSDTPALAAVTGIRIEQPGLHRFVCEIAGQTFHSNPVCCSRDCDHGIYWGDPHIHTALSNCMVQYSRSLCCGLNAARYLSCLDWAGAADHVSNGRCELARWKEESNVAEAYDDPPAFVTLPAYEASLKGGAGGDNNVYMTRFPSLFVDEHDGGNTRTICAKLAELARAEGFEFFIVPHHTTRTGKHGEISDEIYPGPEKMPVLEIHSKWGCSEYRGNPDALQKIHEGPSYAVDLLARGLPFGFIGGTDSHATLTFARPLIEAANISSLPGLTAARCKTLERRGVFDAIRSRNCYAAAGERIFLDVSMGGRGMGTIAPDNGRPRRLVLQAAGQTDLRSVEIIRNGQVWQKYEPGTWSFAVEVEDQEDFAALAQPSGHIGKFVYYYVRVRCASGAAAWSSPIWHVAT